MAKNIGLSREKSAHNGCEARPRSFKGLIRVIATPKSGPPVKTMRKPPMLDTEGGACSYTGRYSEPRVVLGNSKWEIPV